MSSPFQQQFSVLSRQLIKNPPKLKKRGRVHSVNIFMTTEDYNLKNETTISECLQWLKIMICKINQ